MSSSRETPPPSTSRADPARDAPSPTSTGAARTTSSIAGAFMVATLGPFGFGPASQRASVDDGTPTDAA